MWLLAFVVDPTFPALIAFTLAFVSQSYYKTER